MKKTRFSEEQIIAVLREQEGGMKTADVSQARDQQRDAMRVEGQMRRHGRVAGAQAEGAEEENGRLKRLLADAMLDNAVLKEAAAKNW